MNQILEEPRGRGRLVGEGKDIKVLYSLVVTQVMIQGAPGLKDVKGRIAFDDPTQEFTLVGKKMTLHLDDGRLLSVWMVGSGQIQGTGGFFKP